MALKIISLNNKILVNNNMDTSRHISLVFGFLNERAEYAVLRNYEGLPDDNASRDIDIIITRGSLKKIKRELVECLCQEGWRIVTYLNSDRLITFVCAKNVGDETEIVQWDFFVNTSVWGVELMSAEEFVEHRVWNGFLYHVDVVGEFLDKYLYNRAVGAEYPEKYKDIRLKITDYRLQIADVSHTEISSHTEPKVFEPKAIKCTDNTDNSQQILTPAEQSSRPPKTGGHYDAHRRVAEKLEEVFGCGSLEVCDEMSGKRLLWNAVKWNLKRRPLGLIAGVCAFLYTFVRNYICSNTGFAIGFTGPDGVGKTTVIDMLIARLGDVFRTAHTYMHFRPMLFGNLGEVAHSAGLKKEVDREFTKPHRGGRVGVMSSLVRLVYYSVDYIVGYWLKVKSQIRITRLVIFDRYYTDVICDSRRSRIFLNYKFLYWFGRVFIPRLDYNILLTAQVGTILSRKRELTEEGIQAINDKIDYLADKRGYKKVLNDGAPEEAVTEILEWVFAEQHKRNMKRIV